MIGSALDKIAGRVDQRFLATLLFPSFVFLAGVGALVATQIGWTRSLDWWSKLDGPRRALLVGAGAAGILLLGSLLAARLRAITQLYEGFWGGVAGRRLAAIGSAWQKHRLEKLDLGVDAQYEARYYRFPPAGVPLLPTQLGNVLRAAEGYPGVRYGLDGVFFWPRLYPLIPDSARSPLADARSDLERLLIVSALATLFALVAVGFAVFGGIETPVWLPSALAGVLIGVAAYRGAVLSALSYGDLVRSCFDLYRRSLLATVASRRQRRSTRKRSFGERSASSSIEEQARTRSFCSSLQLPNQTAHPPPRLHPHNRTPGSSKGDAGAGGAAARSDHPSSVLHASDTITRPTMWGGVVRYAPGSTSPVRDPV